MRTPRIIQRENGSSRWHISSSPRVGCQLPLYLGLILAQCVYVYHFWVELTDLIGAVMGNQTALQHIFDMVAIEGVPRPTKITETIIMLVVLGLIDVVMISNLLIMVIIGGYETFVSRMNLEGHRDQPE